MRGDRLKAARVEAGRSLCEVAATAGVAKGHLSGIENGTHHRPGFDVVMRLAATLGVDPASLAGPESPEATP